MTYRIALQRFVVAPLALLFAGVGLQFWLTPERAAQQFGLEAADASGLAALRADLGGLFVGLALLCWAGAWFERKRPWLLAAAVMLLAVAAGRTIGWISGGGVGFAELGVELAGAAGLVGCALGPQSDRARAGRSRKRAWIGAGLLLVAATAAALLHPGVQQAIFDRAAAQMTSQVDRSLLEDDALRILVVGSSAPLPSASRAKAAVAVFAGGKFYLVDVGPESVENLVLWGLPLDAIGGVLLTHFHSDHIGDLGELQLQTWAGGRKEPLEVYGGPGVDEVVDGFNLAYRQDQGYRTEHHGEAVMPSAAWGMVARTVELDGAPTPAKDRTGLVLDDGSLRITAIEVDHAPIAPAYAYRFDYEGRSVVVTGDLKFHPPLVRGAADADVLVSEAIATSMTRALGAGARDAGRDRTAAVMHDIEDYHITPEEAAEIANQARVKLLVYYHLLPAPDGWLPRQLFARGVDAVRGDGWTIAEDGSLYTLPLGTDEIRVGRVNG